MGSHTVIDNGRAYPSGLPAWCSQLHWLVSPSWRFLIPILALLFPLGCDKGTSNSQSEPSRSSAPVGLVPLSNMVPIKAGTFLRIKYPVTLTHDYWLGKFEVTQWEYIALMGKNPSYFVGDTNRPVEKLTWFEAVAYCQELTRREKQAGHLPAGYQYRLPSEAEWEFACQAGTTNLFSFGDTVAEADPYAWTLENSDGTTHPIGQK